MTDKRDLQVPRGGLDDIAFEHGGSPANLGRTRPAQMIIDSIDWNDAGILVHGSLHENSERATRVLGDYVKLLGRDATFAQDFREPLLTGMDRGSGDALINFEITFRFKAPKLP